MGAVIPSAVRPLPWRRFSAEAFEVEGGRDGGVRSNISSSKSTLYITSLPGSAPRRPTIAAASAYWNRRARAQSSRLSGVRLITPASDYGIFSSAG